MMQINLRFDNDAEYKEFRYKYLQEILKPIPMAIITIICNNLVGEYTFDGRRIKVVERTIEPERIIREYYEDTLIRNCHNLGLLVNALVANWQPKKEGE